jgi:tetratricopeptide (TPR) repeat protein
LGVSLALGVASADNGGVDGQPPQRPKGGLKQRTLVLGTLPKDLGDEDTVPPPAPEPEASDPMATRLEASPGAMAEIARLQRQQQAGRDAREQSTADTARTHVDESTANTARQHAREAPSSADTARTHSDESTADTARQHAQAEATADTARMAVEEATASMGEARAAGLAPKLASVWDQPQPVAQPQAAQWPPVPAAAHGPPAMQPALEPPPAIRRPAQPAAPQPAHAPAASPPQAAARPAHAPAPQQQPRAQPRAASPPRVPAEPSAEDAKAARKAARNARVLMDRGNYDEALSHAHRAMGLNRASAEYAALCGYLVHLSGATESGLIDPCIALFDRAMQLDPKHAGAHYYKGLVLLSAGRSREAIACFERTLDLNPDHLEAARQLREHGRRQAAPRGGGFGRLMKGLKR